ncbi:MAG TPA: glycosyltransferase family 4 protein [Solirubrobacterales bacterium]
MTRGTEKRGDQRVGAGAPALIIVRSPATHNSRELREAHTLRKLGYRPRILGVVSEQVRERQATVQGIPVTRLSPTSPFSWVRMRLGRSRSASTAGPGTAGSPSRDADAGMAMSLAVRVHRWFRTIDFYRRAVAAVRDLRPALIHCNDYNTMWVGVAARLMGGTAVVYDSHELWADRNLRPEPRWWLLACEFLFVRCAHRTITASPGYAEIMARRYRIPPPQVIRNIPADVPPDGSAAGDVRERPADPSRADGEPVAVYVGALTSGRGLEVSIQALAHVPGARLRLVGPSHDRYRAELGELARREGVADRVELAAAVPPERLLDAIRDASVGLVLIQPVCLSYRMSLPNKLFEYVAAGVPVLGSDLPSIGRLINEHQIGLVAQPDQVGDIAAKLSEMLQPSRNDEFRLAVRAAADRLRWSSESRLLADTYIQAAARARDPAPA